MKTLILIYLISLTSAYGQEKPIVQPYKAPETWEEHQAYIENREARLAQINQENESNNRKLLSLNKQIQRLVNLTEGRAKIKKGVLEEVESELAAMKFPQRTISRKAAFFKCVRESIEKEDKVNTSDCKKKHPADFNESDLAFIKKWEKNFGMTSEFMTRKQASLKKDADDISKQIAYYPENAKDVKASISKSTEKIEEFKSKKVENDTIAKNQIFQSCDANTPEINLEERVPFPGAKFVGPFADVPRDNQDGIGSCFANTAKNLLVGLSGGENIASFLDMALQFRKQSKVSLAEKGLDGGTSCETLKLIEQNGYCPQKFASIETGDANPIEGLLATGKGSVETQSNLVTLIANFLKGKENFKKNGPLSEKILSQGKFIVEALQKNPDIKLPFPGVNQEIPPLWAMENAYNKFSDEKKKDLTFEAFRSEFYTHYKKFVPKFTEMLKEKKSAKSIFAVYTQTMDEFIKKHELQENLPQYESTFQYFLEGNETFDGEYKDPKFQKSFNDSLAFFKQLTNKEAMSDGDFMQSCVDEGLEGLTYLKDLQGLVTYLNTKGIDGKELFDDKGEFRDAADLMQLAVAPSCINPANRKKLDFKFTCDDGMELMTKIKADTTKSKDDKVLEMRKRVVLGLIDGQALGNTFPTNLPLDPKAKPLPEDKIRYHINSIVGLRFNKENGQCEYRIRESQNGESTWQSETAIFDKTLGITEVGIKK